MSRSLLVRRPHGAVAAACATALAAVALAGCGGSSSGSGDAQPAAAVPAGVPFYAEAVIRPEGQQKEDVEAALRKLLATDDPDAKIKQALESSDGDLTWSQDIEPWLGERAGIFLSSFSGDSPDGAAIIAATDTDQAQAALEKSAGDDARKQTYKGVDLWQDESDDSLQGVVDGYAVVGSATGVHTVIDTLKGDGVPTLAGASQYQQALDAVGGDDALGTLYVDTDGLIGALSRSGGVPPQALQTLRQTLAASGGSASAAKLSANGDAIALESATIGVKQSSTGGSEGDAGAAVKALPGDAWLGLGIGALGSRLEQALAQVGQVGGLAGFDVDAILQQVQRASGIDVRRDLLSWMGDSGVFARGTSVADIGGGLVVHSSDPARTRDAVTKLRRFLAQGVSSARVRELSGVPGVDRGVSVTSARSGSAVDVLLAAAGSEFVAAIGRPALQAALKPSSTLGDSSAYQAAAGRMEGIAPTFFLDVGPVLRLVSGLASASDQEGFAQARTYLEHLGAIVAGAKRDGDTQRGRVVLTLK